MEKEYTLGKYENPNGGGAKTITINDLSQLDPYIKPDIYSIILDQNGVKTPFHLFVNQIKGSANNIRQVRTSKDGYYSRDNIDNIWSDWTKTAYSFDGITESVPNTAYKKGAIISFVVNGIQNNYVSLIDNNLTTPITNPENWKEITELAYKSDVQYMIDLTVVRSMRKEY